MAKQLYSLGDAYVIGEREHYEDAVEVVSGLKTAGGLILEVAIVCDGVGGRDAGEVAAQTAISVVNRTLAASTETHVPSLLRQAVEQANREVNRLGRGGKCTLALAVILHDGSPFGRLFIASVGDSRIGMVRTVDKDNRQHEKRSIAWMNRIHNVAEDQIAQGVDPQLAYREHNASALTRVLGLYDRVDVDQGFYYKAPDFATAQQRGEEGLALRTADTIFVCSDGLLDRSPIDREPVVSDDKFLRHTLDVNAEAACKLLVSIAQGRKTQDNTSMGMIIVDPHSRYRRTTTPARMSRLVMGAVAVLALATFVLLGLLNTSNQQAEIAALDLTKAQSNLSDAQQTGTQSIFGLTQTATLWTATPAPTLTFPPTPLPTIAAGAVGKRWSLSQPDTQFKSNEALGSSEFSIAEVWGENPNYQSQTYISKDASLKVSGVDQISGSFTLLSQTGDFLVETGSFRELSVRSSGYSAEFMLTGSCMIVDNEPATLSMACLEGTCSYITAVGEISVPLPVGKKIIFNKDQSTPQIVPIAYSDIQEYANNMEKVGGQIGRIDFDECLLKTYIPVPTKVPQASPTAVIPTTERTGGGSTLTCSGGQVVQNGACTCPSGTVLSGGQCGAPPPTYTPKPVEAPPQPTAIPSCSGGRSWDGNSCECPSDKIWNGAICEAPTPVPVCGANQELVDGQCKDKPPVCGDNQELVDGQCKDKPPVCGDNQELVDGQCKDKQSDNGGDNTESNTSTEAQTDGE